MTLRKRLDRLEARHGIGADSVTVTRIIIHAAWREGTGVRGEPKSAMVRGPDGCWQTFDRENGESETDFLARVDALAEG